MTIQPSFDPPRDRSGRFEEYALSAVPDAGQMSLDFADPEAELERAIQRDLGKPADVSSLSPREIQARAHWKVWSGGLPDSVRANAVREAVIAHITEHDGKPQGLPPGDETWGVVEEALTDDDLLLDSAHEVGPMGRPLDRMFGAHVLGEIYDRALIRHEERTVAAQIAQADEVLPRESDTSINDVVRGHRVPQPAQEICLPCGGYGYFVYPASEYSDEYSPEGALVQEYCNSCGGTGKEDASPVVHH